MFCFGFHRGKTESHTNQTHYTSKEKWNMKSTGIVRKVDELGRIVLPIELRRTLNINEKDSLEIFVDNDKIVLQKYEPACIFCGNADDIVNYKGRNVCAECRAALNK